MLKVKLFAKARDLIGSPMIEVPWSDGLTVTALKQELGVRYPAILPLLPQLLVAVNNDYASGTSTVQIADEVACFLPVSGG